MTTADFDVCILGAGAVGLYLADLLSRDGKRRVAVVEAGPERFEDRQEPFFVESRPKEQTGINEGRVTALGGATNTWGGGLIRLTGIDFRELDGHPGTGWPIDYDEVVKHYGPVEEYFGVKPPSPDAEPHLNLGDVSFRRRDIPILGFRKKNFRLSVAPRLRSRANVTFFYDADSRQFEPGGGGTLASIVVGQPGGKDTRIAAKRYVVTAGVVNSYLLARRILAACVTQTRADETGSHFHDHLSMPFARIRPAARGKFSRAFSYRFGRGGLMFGEHFDGDVQGSVHPGAFFHITYDFSNSRLLTVLKRILEAIQRGRISRDALPSMSDLAYSVSGMPRLGLMRLLERKLFLDDGVDIIATVDLEQLPLSRWRLKAEEGGDGVGCSAEWGLDDQDVENAKIYFRASRNLIRRLQGEAAFEHEELFPDPDADPAGFADYVRANSESAFHASGGVRMGTDPATSFVAPSLRLHDVENVAVISTAIFPRAGTSNPTLTILALAHRYAEALD